MEHSENVRVRAFGDLPQETTQADTSSSIDLTETGSLRVDFAQHAFSKFELNDLVCDLNLSKDSAELLSSHLSEKDLLTEDVRITSFKHRHEELKCFLLCKLHGILQKWLWLSFRIWVATI